MSITRRQFLQWTGAAGLALGVNGFAQAAEQEMTLKAAAARAGILYGANSDGAFAQNPEAYRALFIKQCALYACGIWAPAVNTQSDVFDFSGPKADIDFVTSKGLRLTGGHLFWYYHMPDWFGKLKSKIDAEKAVINYVHKVSSHYAGLTYSWNVVNEGIEPKDGQPLGLRKCWPLTMIGPEYINLAFRAARIGDPKALLIYNDSGMELDTAEEENRRTSLLYMLDDLQRSKTPIDGVGLQSHLKLQNFAFNEKKYRAFLSEIAGRGLKILITELDVLDVGAPGDVTKRDQQVADIYKQFLGTALDEKAVSAVVTWGLSDRYTWLTPKYAPEFARADGLPTRPLPFDADFKAKPAFTAILNAFKNAPSRQA